VAQLPQVTYFKPRGVPLALLERVDLTVDELEALRLADLEGLYQEEAAQRMHVSRQTFGRIVDRARRKVADALTGGKALSIAGGTVEVAVRGRPTRGRGRCRRHGRGRDNQP
jgi:predicted DNA-binding protein (UPF0251 family)